MELKNERYDERCRIIKLISEDAERIYNPLLKLKAFDGCKDTPVEVLHVVLIGIVKYLTNDFMSNMTRANLIELEARWRAFNCEGVSMAPLQPKYMICHYGSFIGKEYRIFIQAAPFVFYPLMSQDMKAVWDPLCQIGSMSLQKRIPDMDLFIDQLECHIKNFMYHIAKMSGRWANKPKFHMLLHLPESMRRFGPANLFATEKFESYNGVIRNSSIHSNRQSPGRDLSNGFTNYQIIRSLLSGTKLLEKSRGCYFQAASKVSEMFEKNPIIQMSLGYNSSQLHTSDLYPCAHGHQGPKNPKEIIPNIFKKHYPNSEISRVKAMKIGVDDIIREGTFVLVCYNLIYVQLI